VEDWAVQLPGGTDSVKATYSGDDSFNSSSSTTAFTITKAATTTTQPNVSGPAVGQSVNISVYITTTSSGAAPSGTVTFYANGTALNGTTSYFRNDGTPNSSAITSVNFNSNVNAFPTSGTYSITASYNGDSNYSTSTSAASTVTVLYPVPRLVATPPQQSVTYGSSATINALVASTNQTTYPTGTVTFLDAINFSTVSGPTTCTQTTDTSGNFACQAAGTFTVTSGDPITVRYSGDANYPSTSTMALINMPDFSLAALGSISVVAGQSQTLTLQIFSSNGLNGALGNFGCSGLPAEAACTFSPTTVTLPSNGAVSTTLTVSTTAIGQAHRRAANDHALWRITSATLLLGLCFVGIPSWRRRTASWGHLGLVALLLFVPSCGGGNGGGGGGGTPNPTPSIITLSPAQVAAGSANQTLTIAGTGFLTSSKVKYNGVSHTSTYLSSTQISMPLSGADVTTIGSYPVVVTNPTPGGGSSVPMNFGVVSGTPTGTFPVTVTATVGPITHSTTLTLFVQ
jgi:hypothetical protein